MGFYLALKVAQTPRLAWGWSSTAILKHSNRRPTRHITRRWKSTESENSLDSALDSFDPTFTTYTKRELTPEQQDLLDNWRVHPSINPTLSFPTLLISPELLQNYIEDPRLDKFLAKPSNWDFLNQINPRIKLVQEFNDTHKLLLLLHDKNNDNTISRNPGDITLECLRKSSDGRGELEIEFGPDFELPINFRQLSFGFILDQLLPVPPPSAYEQIGHVAHFNLKAQHSCYGELIGNVLRETNPSIDTVVSKVGEVKGKYRTYDLEVLAGPSNFETTVVEHGVAIRLNVANCYWSTRLSGERQELMLDIEKSTDTSRRKKILVADVFCGVGAICLLLAKRNPHCTIMANDWNPKAIEYFKESVTNNGLDNGGRFLLSCGDAYDFMIELGTDRTADETPDHILMNFPLEAPSFLGSLRWWSSKTLAQKFKETNRYPRFHVYTFARPSAKHLNDEEEVAVNLVADELIPEMGESAESSHRRDEFNELFGANVRTRMVRDVAPGKVVVCVSFSLTPVLLRFIQGDFTD